MYLLCSWVWIALSVCTHMCVYVLACIRTYCMRVCMPRVSQCGPPTWAQCLTECLGWSWDNCWLSGVFSFLLPPLPFSCPHFDYNQVFFLILQWAKEQHTVQRASQWAASCWMVSNTWGSDQLVNTSTSFLVSSFHLPAPPPTFPLTSLTSVIPKLISADSLLSL